jgi:glutamyl-Q tRNA(Asp) synthetase
MNPGYIGRFAPSPTGPLHLGSLLAALGSWLDARAHRGRWLLRIEDLDRAREAPAAAAAIQHALEAHGLHWDGPVLRQSGRTEHYAAALERLRAAGLVYACGCTRAGIARLAGSNGGETIYPGTCRAGLAPGMTPRLMRLNTAPAGSIHFDDRLHGPQSAHPARTQGDIVLRRVEGYHAYHLAVVVDDAAQGVTQVVRGADLLPQTPVQIYLQDRLRLPHPGYAHLPLVRQADGIKLSKQTGAAALDDQRPAPALCDALRRLGHAPPADLVRARPGDILAWAVEHWRLERVPVEGV